MLQGQIEHKPFIEHLPSGIKGYQLTSDISVYVEPYNLMKQIFDDEEESFRTESLLYIFRNTTPMTPKEIQSWLDSTLNPTTREILFGKFVFRKDSPYKGFHRLSLGGEPTERFRKNFPLLVYNSNLLNWADDSILFSTYPAELPTLESLDKIIPANEFQLSEDDYQPNGTATDLRKTAEITILKNEGEISFLSQFLDSLDKVQEKSKQES